VRRSAADSQRRLEDPDGEVLGRRGGRLREGCRRDAGSESTARRIRCLEPQFIHGLLQTEAYARAGFATDTTQPAEVIEQWVRFRMERQRRPMDGVTIVRGEGGEPPGCLPRRPGAARHVDHEDERAERELVWRAVLDKSVSIKEWE
jgi:hypothetical protein